MDGPFEFPPLVAKCPDCGRHSTENVIGRECRMPQPVGPMCKGILVDTREQPQPPDGPGAGSQGHPREETIRLIIEGSDDPPQSGERIVLMLGGVPIGGGTVRAMTADDMPPSKVKLTDRAKATAQRAFCDCPAPDSKRSLDTAIEAAAGIIVSDNILIIAEAIALSARMMKDLGRSDDAMVLETVIETLQEYAGHLDPKRPE